MKENPTSPDAEPYSPLRLGPCLRRRASSNSLAPLERNLQEDEESSSVESEEDSDAFESADQQHVTSIDTIECLSVNSSMFTTSRKSASSDKNKIEYDTQVDRGLLSTLESTNQIERVADNGSCCFQGQGFNTPSKILVVNNDVNFCQSLDSFFTVMNLHNNGTHIEYVYSGIEAVKKVTTALVNKE